MGDTATSAIMHEGDKQIMYVKAILFNIKRKCVEITTDVEMLENMIKSAEMLAEEARK